MRKFLLAASVLALAATAASAQPRRLSVTIYNSGQTLVEDARTETLAAGRQRIEFKDVSPQIRSETVTLSAEGISIIEQNFDYDLLSPQKLMEKAVGETVKIVRTNPGNGQQVTETAKILAVNNGVVLQIGDRIEILREDGVPTRVIFDKVPPNLRARPTLSVTVDAAQAGPRETKLTYLTGGMGWNADYVALFDEKNGKMDVQGWITLSNNTGVDFADAEVQLVAGNVGQVRYSPPAIRGAGTVTGTAVPLADFYLYPLKERTTIAQAQSKQVSFLDVIGAPATKAYRLDFNSFNSQETPIAAAVKLEFAAGGGAEPMPAGTVRFYVRDQQGNPKFIGENEIGHTPAGSDLSIQTGQAFDVTVQPTLVTADRRISGRTRYTMSYLVRNARPEPVVVQLRQSGVGRNGKVIEETVKGRRLNADTFAWDVPTPANGETTLTVTLDAEY
ncbi:MAG: DUF4139 domain-containing protein [Caulobacteraceae bacterium]|nr:MAG: DUF4139 domain-containing protein [Caulobacteraceae bacterium]